ncbi:MAG TPA: SDR family NAD(P)-dependent oxidoreductase [Allosphingosinicella sp.]|jgi:uncharacterized oxidoreductase
MVGFRLEGRTALVTGGASGIGLALVRLLLRRGAARILIVGRDPARLAEVRGELGPRVETLGADLSDPAEVDRLLAEIRRLAPDLSLLVNNAASQRLTDFVSGDPIQLLPALRSEIAANFSAVVALSVGLLPLLARQPSAAILNVTSGLALAPKKSSPVYCAAKAGVRSFTQALRYQCEDGLPNLRIVEALPPLVDTSMTRGRGRGKMAPEACAAEIVAGLESGRDEIFVGKSKLLRAVLRAAPALGRKIMRNG